MKHGKQAANDFHRVGVPVRRLVRVDPGAALEVVGDAVQPDDARCGRPAPRVDVAVRLEKLGRVHRCIPHDEDLPAIVEAAQDVARGNRVGARHAGAGEQVIVDAVVEVVGAEVAQAALLVERRQQAAHGLEVGVHGAADVHQQQQAHVVAPWRPEHELDLAGVLAGLVDRLVEVELGLFTGSRQVSQAPQRHAQLTEIEGDVGTVILEPSLLGDLHRRTALGGAADADARGMLAVVPKGRLASRSHPAVAAVVPLRLLAQRFQKTLHELVRAQPFQLRQLFGRQVGKVLRVAEPLEDAFRDLVAHRPFDPFEHAREDAIVGIEVGFALDQAGAAKMVEAEQGGTMQSLLHGAQECLPFLDGDGNALFAQAVEEIEKHLETGG